MSDTINILFHELAALSDGRPFDGLAVGTFTDMLGREVEFTADDLKTYVANTQAAIATATTESGEVVGLPIDVEKHAKGDGAGWLVGIELQGDKIRLIPKWTEIGLDLITKGIRRFFSATVDIVNKVILGGTLTNWPAVRGKNGHMILRPIELSSPLHQIEVTETDGEPAAETATINGIPVATASATITDAGNSSTHTLTINADQLELALDNGEASQEPPNNLEDEVIDMTQDEIREFMKAELAQVMQDVVQTAVPANGEDGEGGEGKPKFDILQVLDMAGTKDEMVAEFKQYMLDQHSAMRQEAQREAARQIAAVRREANVSEFCQKVTGGTEDHPRGLPVNSDDLKEFLMRLQPADLEFAMKVLQNVQEQGLTEFRELGHGRRLQGTSELPAEFARLLDSWVAEGHSVNDFFKINAVELGDMAQYNLAAYKEANNG